jgi:hypothetical protein
LSGYLTNGPYARRAIAAAAFPAWIAAAAVVVGCEDDQPSPSLTAAGSAGSNGDSGANQAGAGTGGSVSSAGTAGAGVAGSPMGGTPGATSGGSTASGGTSTAGTASGGQAAAAGVGGVLASAGRGGEGGTSGGVSSGGKNSSGGDAGREGTAGSAGSSETAGSGGGLNVDRTDPRLHHVEFTAEDADPEASRALGRQHAYLDTRVASLGKLVVYLHGADDFADCGNGALGTLVSSWGFHWFGPCFLSNYGVDNCGNDIEGCRLEAFEGVDHHAFLQIEPPDSIERRVVRGLLHLEEIDPQGGWVFFIDGEKPRWSEIVITGHSHGASTSSVIGIHRRVARVVALAGPNDPGQAWLTSTPLTPRDAFFGFTHAGDGQHAAHLAAFAALGFPGMPTRVDGAAAPYMESHRLYSNASTGDAHASVTSGNISEYVPVWRYLYGAP